MNNFIDLLISYWKPIVGLLFLIVAFIVALIRKRPFVDILSDIYSFAIIAVKYIETFTLSGNILSSQEKLDKAVDFVNFQLGKKYPNYNKVSYEKVIVRIIEDLLSTPHKKG